MNENRELNVIEEVDVIEFKELEDIEEIVTPSVFGTVGCCNF